MAKRKIEEQPLSEGSDDLGERYIKGENIPLEAVLRQVRATVGPDVFARVERDLLAYYAPKGVKETFLNTWDTGKIGKFHTVCGFLGAGVVLVTALELLGAGLDLPEIRVGSRLGEWARK